VGTKLEKLVDKRRLSAEFWMLLPTILILAGLSVYPFIFLVRMTFMEFSLVAQQPSKFVGLTNWSKMLTHEGVRDSWIVTLKYYVVALTLQLTLGILMAVLIDRIKLFREGIIAVIIGPVFLAPVLAGLMWRFLLDPSFGIYYYWMEESGFFSFLEKVGLSDINNIFGSLSLALPAIIMMDAWQWTPLIVLIILAGLHSIPPQVIEAASVDGASSWQQFWLITLPLLKSTILVALLIRMMDIVRFFTKIYITTRGGPADATKIISLRIYENAFRFFKLGYASTIGFMLLIMTIVLGLLFVKISAARE